MSFLNINLNWYRNFYYVAKYGNFTKASEYINISQSALSISIIKLEKELNTKLFFRNKSGLQLTNQGKELFKKLEDINNIINNNTIKEEINIGCLRFIADNYLDDVIINFKKNYPKINIKFDFSNDTELFQKLKKGELDILICRYPLFYKFESFIKVEKIIDVKNVFVCSKEFYNQNKLNIEDKNFNFPLILPNSSEKRRIIEEYLVNKNINFHVPIEIPNSLLLKKLILDSMGIGYINLKSVLNEIKENKLIQLELFNDAPIDNITIIYNYQNTNNIILDFTKILKDVLKK